MSKAALLDWKRLEVQKEPTGSDHHLSVSAVGDMETILWLKKGSAMNFAAC